MEILCTLAPSRLSSGRCGLVKDCTTSAVNGQILPEETDGTIYQKTAQPSSGSGLYYSPTILTNTGFRRRLSRLSGQPFRLAPKICSHGRKSNCSWFCRMGAQHHGCCWTHTQPPSLCSGKTTDTSEPGTGASCRNTLSTPGAPPPRNAISRAPS